ncbi:hypothetical protein PTSG_01043 [Salpingoeca rosetta]|uniref:Calpain catalytic domain-containing protein n=1 Tax=Salpingoeca rosetta (strain ATCC 50818 / BSB-021) TaxID=946362 RepID=F2TY84_SALR5|nr:uncharacterized protein PTSG_01043 [Salpingoeca rosetta]EGD76343.1 hypothetical protein PTSG_01043 [Salpingoeca rosetta]|eukprot:XP_004998518.1 hypothetical protein PTSG_01043 [Salpingoeca rosetta]
MAKRVKSSRPKSSAGKPGGDDVSSSGSATFFPKWTEADILAERWSADAAKGKDRTKWPFEDPLGVTPMPRSLEDAVSRWRRMSGPSTAHMVAPSRFRPVPAFRVLAKSDQLWLRKKRMKFVERTEEPWVSLYHKSQHIMESPLMREIISALSFLQRPPQGSEAHTVRPWHLVHPRGKDGQAAANTTGGKYAVKLFWLGHWRKVVVDDVVPFDAENRILLPQSTEPELWPIIVTKALLRIASLSFDLRPGTPEAGQFNVMAALTGWYPVVYRLLPSMTEQSRAAMIARVNALCTYSRLTQDKEDLVQDPRPQWPDVGPEEKRRGSGRRSAARSAASSRAASGRASIVEPAPDAHPEQLENWFVTASVNRDKNTNSDAGLDPSRSHEVRILACHAVLLPGEDECRYIFELTSPIAWSTGSLGFEDDVEGEEDDDSSSDRGDGANTETKGGDAQDGDVQSITSASELETERPDDPKGWTKPLCIALGVSLDRLRTEERELKKMHAAGKPTPHFRFFMTSEEFFRTFSSVRVYHKSHRYSHHVVLQRVRGQGVSLQQRTGDEEPAPVTDYDAMELRNHERWFLHVDSTEPSLLLLNLAIGPPVPPASNVTPPSRAPLRSATALEIVPEEPGPDRDVSPKGARSRVNSRVNTMTGADVASLASRTGTLSSRSLELPPFPSSRPSSALDLTPAHMSATTTGPQEGCVLMHHHKWDAVTYDTDPVVYLRTSSSLSAFCKLPAGRHILAVTIQHPFACSLSILAHKPVVLGTASAVLPRLAQPSCTMQAYVTAVEQIVETTLKSPELADAKQAASNCVKKLHRHFGFYPAELWEPFSKCIQSAIEMQNVDVWQKREQAVRDVVALLGKWIESVALPKSSAPKGLAPPALLVQEYSHPNLLANVSVRADGSVRLTKADGGEGAAHTLPVFGAGLQADVARPQAQTADGTGRDGDSKESDNHSNDKNKGGEVATQGANGSGDNSTGSLTPDNGSEGDNKQAHNTAGNAVQQEGEGTATSSSRPTSSSPHSINVTVSHTEGNNNNNNGKPANATKRSNSNSRPNTRTSTRSRGRDSTATTGTNSGGQPDFAAQQFSEEDEKLREQAAVQIQAVMRGFLTRKRLQEERTQKEISTLQQGAAVWDALATRQQSESVMIEAAKMFMSDEKCPAILSAHPFAADAAMNLNVLLATGDGELSQNQHLEFLFQKRITVESACYVRFTLLVDTEGPEVPPHHLDSPLPVSAGLRILDCATGRLLPFAGEQTLPVELQPTQQGYKLLGWCASASYNGPVHWKLRVTSKDTLPQDLIADLRPPTFDDEHTSPIMRDRRQYPLLLQVHSKAQPVHICASLDNSNEGTLLLAVKCDGRQLFKQTVKHRAFFPLVLPPLAADDFDEDDDSSQPEPSEPEPKGKSKSAKKKRTASNARPDTRAVQQSVPKRTLEISCQLLDVPEDFGEEPLPPSGTQRRSKSASMKRTVSGPAITIKATCMSKIEFSEDTREQDELKQIMLGWEAADPGRREKAQTVRAERQSTVNPEEAKRVVPAPAEQRLQLLDEELMTKREREKQRKVREFREQRQAVAERREKEAAERDVIKTRTINQATDRRKQNQQLRDTAGKLRQMYRQRVLDKLEAERKAEEERLRLEREAQEAEAAARASSKKKKGKK